MKLKDKIVLITGAGRGMGRAMALRSAREGAQVVIAETDETTAKQTFDDIGRQGLLAVTDIAEVAEINALVEKIIATFGRIDALVNNAGVTRSLDFFAVTESDWDWMYSINARGLFFCMQRVAREMVKRRAGKIVNIASIAGKGFRGTSNIAYAGTKGAVIAMTRVGAAQLAPFNINVNAICPGVTMTDMVQILIRGMAQRGGVSEEEARRSVEQMIPLGRANAPEDIANMALFLMSSESDNITGQSYNVDGGIMFD